MENDRECPICCQENQKILSKIRQPDKLLTQAWLFKQPKNLNAKISEGLHLKAIIRMNFRVNFLEAQTDFRV